MSPLPAPQPQTAEIESTALADPPFGWITAGPVPGRRNIGLLLSLAFSLVALTGLTLSFQSLIIIFDHIYLYPIMDMAGVLRSYLQSSWLDFLLFRDNEHLPVLVMPLFAADAAWFQASGLALVVAMNGLAALTALLLADEVRRAGLGTAGTVAAASFAAAALFWLIHWENLIWAKQIHMYVSAVFVLWAGRRAIALDLADRPPTLAEAAGLGLIAAGALFSFGYGAVAWIAVLILAATGRWPLRALAVPAGLLAVALLAYAWHYAQADAGSGIRIDRALTDPLLFGRFLLHFLAYPLDQLLNGLTTPLPARIAALILTLAALAAAAAVLARVLLTHRQTASRRDLFAAFLLLFAQGSAVVIALARLDYGIDGARQPRYAIIQLAFWAGLAYAAPAALTSWPPARRRALFPALASAIMTLMATTQDSFRLQMEARRREHWESLLAVINRIDDPRIIERSFYPNAQVITDLDSHLRQRRWSIYAQPQPHWLDQPLTRLFTVTDRHRCRGYLDFAGDLGRLHNQSFVQGWAWDRDTAQPPEWIVLADAQGIIRGLGHNGWQRDDVTAQLAAAAATKPGWYAYVDAPAPLTGFTAYAVIDDNNGACPLARSTGG